MGPFTGPLEAPAESLDNVIYHCMYVFPGEKFQLDPKIWYMYRINADSVLSLN